MNEWMNELKMYEIEWIENVWLYEIDWIENEVMEIEASLLKKCFN